MLRATWRYLGTPARLAIGLVVLLPALAEAQLFPNRTLNRQRTPCPAESPFNAQVRRDYFGYYPTCWSRFPAGWDCPGYNPEKPDVNASFEKIKFGNKRPISGDDLGPDLANPDQPMDGPPANPEEPVVPIPNPGRSPFELDPSPAKPAGPAPAQPDPFETPVPGAPAPGNPGPPPANRALPPTGLREMPSLPAIAPTTSAESTLEPGSMVMVPEPDATLASNAGPSRPDLGPLPSMPAPPSSPPGSIVTESDTMVGLPPTAPAQAPRRRGILGGLFGSRNSQKR